MRKAKTLIRLDGCPGWSESSLGAHSLCWFCHVAAHILKETLTSSAYGIHTVSINNRNFCKNAKISKPRHPLTANGILLFAMIEEFRHPKWIKASRKVNPIHNLRTTPPYPESLKNRHCEKTIIWLTSCILQ